METLAYSDNRAEMAWHTAFWLPKLVMTPAKAVVGKALSNGTQNVNKSASVRKGDFAAGHSIIVNKLTSGNAPKISRRQLLKANADKGFISTMALKASCDWFERFRQFVNKMVIFVY